MNQHDPSGEHDPISPSKTQRDAPADQHAADQHAADQQPGEQQPAALGAASSVGGVPQSDPVAQEPEPVAQEPEPVFQEPEPVARSAEPAEAQAGEDSPAEPEQESELGAESLADEAAPAEEAPSAEEVAPAAEDEGDAEEGDAEPVAAAAEPKQWYVLKVQSNREKSIRESLLRRVRRDGLEEYFGEIVIPTEKRVETKGGKRRVFEQKLYPGYIMIHMVLNDETWYLVRDTGGVGDFTGAAGKPLPMPEEEVRAMLRAGEESPEEPKKVKIAFSPGDTVKIKEGPFESFEGSINSIDEASGKVSVMIQILGRSAPVDLEYWQVERI